MDFFTLKIINFIFKNFQKGANIKYIMLNVKNYQSKSGYSGSTKLLNRLLKDKNLDQDIKEQINQIYFNNFIKENNVTLEETVNRLNNIKIKCGIYLIFAQMKKK